jgi:uncharacterized protein (TIGR02001 family)
MLARSPAWGHETPVNQRDLFDCAIALGIAAMLALQPLAAWAGESPLAVTGSVSALSQYRFRGLSRSDGQPAVQGDILASLAGGAYAGVLLASETPGAAVDFGHGEIDLYAGYDHALGSSGLMVDLGLRGYLYPDHGGANLVELSAALHRQIGPIDLRSGLAWAPPQAHLGRTSPAGALRSNAYAYAQARADLPGTPVSLHAHAGHSAGGLDYTGAYWDYRLGAGVTHKALGLDLSLVGTNVSRAAAAAAPQGPSADPLATWRAARSAGVLSLSYQF